MRINLTIKPAHNMASLVQQETNGLSPNTAQHVTDSVPVVNTDSGVLPGEMSELRRVQLAHEGMRLLLCSEIKQAEELFRVSRYASVLAS